jgi:hypothetical protein
MSALNEEYRLRHFRCGELPEGIYEEVNFQCDSPQDCIDKVVAVMALVLQHDPDRWPSDDFWRDTLPEWLLQTFKSYTASELSEILSDRSRWADTAWTVGSWLDRVRDRDWEWWSLFDKGDGKVTVYVAVQGHPTSIKALEHLIAAAGGKINGRSS